MKKLYLFEVRMRPGSIIRKLVLPERKEE